MNFEMVVTINKSMCRLQRTSKCNAFIIDQNHDDDHDVHDDDYDDCNDVDGLMTLIVIFKMIATLNQSCRDDADNDNDDIQDD